MLKLSTLQVKKSDYKNTSALSMIRRYILFFLNRNGVTQMKDSNMIYKF